MEKHEPTVPVPTGDALETLVFDAERAGCLRLMTERHAALVKFLTFPIAALQGDAKVGKTSVMKVLATAWEFLDGYVVRGALAARLRLPCRGIPLQQIELALPTLTRGLSACLKGKKSNVQPQEKASWEG